MTRIPQGPGVKGSQKWIQKLVNEKPDLLNSFIRTQIDLSSAVEIHWHSPLAEDEFAEYSDQAFLDLLGIKPPKVPLRISAIAKECRVCVQMLERGIGLQTNGFKRDCIKGVTRGYRLFSLLLLFSANAESIIFSEIS